MPRTKISEFSSTPASNTDIDSINISEGCAPSGINDAIRELMAQLKDFQTGAVGDSFNGPVGTSTAAAGAFTTISASGNVTLSGGTANGVAYLNGSKVVTSGSALSFDGTNLTLGTTGSLLKLARLNDGALTGSLGSRTSGNFSFYNSGGSSTEITVASSDIRFDIGASEQMRLTSTGLGIGTSSPSQKLEVIGGAAIVGTDSLLLQRPVVPSFDGQGAPALVWRFYSTGTTYTTGAYIQALAEAAWTSTSAPTGIRFYTVSSGSTTTAERARIDSSGNLLVGTTSGSFTAGSRGNITVGGSGSAILAFQTGGTAKGYLFHDATDLTLANDISGSLRFLTGGSERARIASGGTVCINTTSFIANSGERLTVTSTGDTCFFQSTASGGGGTSTHMNRSASSGNFVYFTYSGSFTPVGSINTNGSNTTYSTSSDYRLKNSITPMTGALARVAQLKPVTYKWNADGSDGEGFIAHELQAVVPECVVGEKDAVNEDGSIKPQGIDTSFLVATLTAAIQEQQAIIESLKARLDAANL